MKTKCFPLFLFGSFALAWLPSKTLGQTLSLVQTGFNTDYIITVNTTGASSETGYDTMQTLAVSNESPGLNLPSSLNLFCIELGQFTPTPTPETYTILPGIAAVSLQGSTDTRGALDTLAGITTSGIGATRAANLELLYGFEFGSSYSPQSLSVYNQAVFQLAVWQLSHSDSFTLAAGDPGFYFSNPNNSNLLGDAQTLLTQVHSNASSITPMNLAVLHSEDYQDFLVPIPEPSAFAAILGLGALGFATCIRRRPISV